MNQKGAHGQQKRGFRLVMQVPIGTLAGEKRDDIAKVIQSPASLESFRMMNNCGTITTLKNDNNRRRINC